MFRKIRFPGIIRLSGVAPIPRKRETIITRAGLFFTVLSLAAAFGAPAWADADQRYVVSGNDSYQVGRSDLRTSITYNGTQQLSVSHSGSQTRFKAQVRYTREDQAGKVPARATFVQDMSPSGELHDRTDLDPDYLTVLNQPFAIQLDTPTLRDLQRLRGRVPFDFPSPITGGTLHGFLQRSVYGAVASHRAIGVKFQADGPMSGPLPDHSSVSIEGTMRMNGTAYYALTGPPILLALDETLTISGNLRGRDDTTPVTIVYKRSIKASDSGPAETEAKR